MGAGAVAGAAGGPLPADRPSSPHSPACAFLPRSVPTARLCPAPHPPPAYAIFLAVTLPLVVLSLAYVLGMMLASTLKKWKVRRDADALSGEAITPRGYKWYRWAQGLQVALVGQRGLQGKVYWPSRPGATSGTGGSKGLQVAQVGPGA